MNIPKLKGKMAESGVGANLLCEKTGISRSAFYRVMNGQRNLDLREAESICDVLGIVDPMEKVSIFLTSCPNNGAV